MKPRTAFLRARLPLAATLVLAPLALAGCSSATPPPSPAPAATVSHVHGITVDPVTTKILLATHDGLFDASKKTPVKVSDTIDLMGFTPTGDPNVYFASGHPGPGTSLPNPVGLIRSADAGKTWQQVSRGGQSDFHALTVSGGGLVAFDGQMRTSTDGTTWQTSTATFTPAVLAGSPASSVVLATTQEGVQRSTDGGKSWRSVPGSPVIQFAAIAASVEKAPTEAVGVTPDGTVYVSSDAGLSWTATGKISGQVEAVTAKEGSAGKPWLWASTTDGVQVSTDGGATFRPAAS
ncbi:F510_1955 family glycosylhydrolase [Arthrobacter cryoconiti]|uniref:F510_1955 family glycosylhydrolase n=1 Tax=Arthrobacter cryoconiti TaxID=748907 RepID=A0ABV8R4N2_9MICC|nr:exo-alpha-sialidase [Arthrobacter cryoconiti]MCC9069385.1 exo-alpha-sialidase [Arthrobacter cryoconiti]